ncbi:MAG: enoyl-CoA hydratase [Gammaproteobacteria bacterium]|nr:enoyl-CoA hydratase [Gammaproteobacteria bacterium]
MTAAQPATSEAPLVLREDRDGIATVTLNRPDKFNALSHALLDALQAELDAIGNDSSVRVVVLAANGRAFCTGHDLKEMRADSSEEVMRSLFDKCSRMMQTVTRIPQPVIARVHSIATAAGCQLVATCDLAIASEEAKFATSGINLGLFCSTPMVALTRNVSRKVAMEMLVTGDFIDAATAARHGLVNRAVPADELDDAVSALAGKIAAQPAVSIAMGKRLFYQQVEAATDAAYAMASETMACNMTTEDARDGIDAFLAKQPRPEWKGR